ncbi:MULTISPECIES: hypothetical protein [Paenibacillus]|uniref:PH domain-containing protein n=1 Tax=Paenibacillus cucumis (ex Kampfer et al. 2016) TaxID=1776858 RepID=A0ABS7KFL5_9BACL|nr:hypothetical protein [Paenibacillus cucumis (ex Kampfer et al. 2016)]MBY0202922.1 hypothetical protein [Paenibacillus cucumis (ex Kampfer et al. 2016)]
MMLPKTSEEHHQGEIRYRRITAIWKGSLCFLFLVLCVLLLWVIVAGQTESVEKIYYPMAAILGMWMVGPFFFMFWTRSIQRVAILVSWNEQSLHAGQRHIPWNQIRKIELATPTRNKWQLSASPMYALYLKDGTRVHIHTDHLFGKKELQSSLSTLQKTLREHQGPDLD